MTDIGINVKFERQGHLSLSELSFAVWTVQSCSVMGHFPPENPVEPSGLTTDYYLPVVVSIGRIVTRARRNKLTSKSRVIIDENYRAI